jgi:hypothetical protein
VKTGDFELCDKVQRGEVTKAILSPLVTTSTLHMITIAELARLPGKKQREMSTERVKSITDTRHC